MNTLGYDREMPSFDEEHGVLNMEETEEEMEVELVEEEPLFLRYAAHAVLPFCFVQLAQPCLAYENIFFWKGSHT